MQVRNDHRQIRLDWNEQVNHRSLQHYTTAQRSSVISRANAEAPREGNPLDSPLPGPHNNKKNPPTTNYHNQDAQHSSRNGPRQGAAETLPEHRRQCCLCLEPPSPLSSSCQFSSSRESQGVLGSPNPAGLAARCSSWAPKSLHGPPEIIDHS
jgi:hypothetical protein